MYSYGPPHMAGQKQDNQLEHTFSSYVRIRDVALKTSQRRWTIGKSGEMDNRACGTKWWHDDDDGIYIYIYMLIFIKKISTKKKLWNFIILMGTLYNHFYIFFVTKLNGAETAAKNKTSKLL